MDYQALRLLGSAALAQAARGERRHRRAVGAQGVRVGGRAERLPPRVGGDGRRRPGRPRDDRAVQPVQSGQFTAGWFTRYIGSFAGTIAGGTSEIQRNIIAQHVLKLPTR